MSLNFVEDLNIVGHLQILKVSDKGEEVLFDDHNIIVSGMGLGLAYFFSLSGTKSVIDFQIDRFQIGVSGSDLYEDASTNELLGALSSVTEYGIDASLNTVSSYHALTSEDYNSTPEWFGYIPTYNIARLGNSSVRYTMTLDKEAANSITRDGEDRAINEIGLFMKNPLGNRFGLDADSSVLVAYRNFSNIIKTEEFALVFKWTLSF